MQNGVGYICHCCSCCCNLLRGITEHGYPNTIVTSNFVARSDDARCTGCGVCANACPIDALKVAGKQTEVDDSVCLGCGVCVFACKRDAMHLQPREKRVMVRKIPSRAWCSPPWSTGRYSSWCSMVRIATSCRSCKACCAGFGAIGGQEGAYELNTLRSRFWERWRLRRTRSARVTPRKSANNCDRRGAVRPSPSKKSARRGKIIARGAAHGASSKAHHPPPRALPKEPPMTTRCLAASLLFLYAPAAARTPRPRLATTPTRRPAPVTIRHRARLPMRTRSRRHSVT